MTAVTVRNVGDVTSEVGFGLPTDPETVRAPDLAFEVVSPGDTSTAELFG